MKGRNTSGNYIKNEGEKLYDKQQEEQQKINQIMQRLNMNHMKNENLESDENTDNNENSNNNANTENIKEMGTVSEVNPNKEIYFLSIIGEIEGHNILPPNSKATKYEHIIPQIIGAEIDNEVKGIMLLINTVGGDVEAGLAISELICSISKPTVSIVLGGGHSIGNALAVSTKYSFITQTGTMTIHPIRTNGFIIGVPQTFRYFQKMQERITNFIVENSNVNREELLKYMYDTDEIANDVGTVLNSEEVIKIGLINEIGGFKEALAKLREMISESKNE